MVVRLFLVMMAVASAKEPLIAGRAAIRVLKHHKVAEPIFDAASFRTKELFTAAIGTTRDMSPRSGFVLMLGRRAPSCFHLNQPSLFLRVFSMLSARQLVRSVHDDDLRCFLVV